MIILEQTDVKPSSEISPIKSTTSLGKAGHTSDTATKATIPIRSPELTPNHGLVTKGTKLVSSKTPPLNCEAELTFYFGKSLQSQTEDAKCVNISFSGLA